MLENIEEHFSGLVHAYEDLSLRTRLCSCVRNLSSCVRKLVLESLRMWASAYVCVLNVCIRRLGLTHAYH